MESSKITYARMVDTNEPITRVDFSIYNNKQVVDDSAISDPNGITIAEIYNNGEAVQGGVIDRRLGVTEQKIECLTCGETALKCIGHFGHIKFVEAVFHMGFLPFLKNILSCICIRCNKLLVYKNEKEIAKLLRNKQGKQRFQEIRNACKGVTHCQKDGYGCGTPAHKITVDKKYANVFLLAEAIKKNGESDETSDGKKRAPQILTAQLCYDILKGVSDDDCRILGFDPEKSRPEDMIIINFPVPPVQVRPSIKMEILSSSTIDDDLTHKLVDIIKNNENLKDTKGDGSLIKNASVNDDYMLLQFHAATFYANDIVGLPRSQQKNKKVTKSLSERLKGKEGRIRGNLQGKRTDQSGRTVITSDPFIGLDVVGVPIIIAMNLTYPEPVTKYNMDEMRKIVKNGKYRYPGANFIIKNIVDPEGNEVKHIYHLKYVEKAPELVVGDIVERHLRDNDIVMFNRQPSLHKMSMMGHRIHIINNPEIRTFRVNVSVTDPYNADFDGDEMNIHVSQSINTATELRLIAGADKRFVSPATSKIAINPKQDALMGTFVLTNDNMRVDWKDCMNILMATTIGLDFDVPKNRTLSGKLLYSAIIPKEINVVKRKDAENYAIRVINGLLTDGILGKSEISAIIQKTWFQYGSHETKNFIDNLQRMILQYLMRQGYTVGVGDAVVPDKIHEAVYKIIETKRKEALGSITEYENDPYIMTPEAFEETMKNTLTNALQDEIQKLIMANLSPDSGILNAVMSQSSGTIMNPAQIIGCIGQIIVENKRIQPKFNNRTLPVFHQFDNSPFARGFCYNSFMTGLNPIEFFFQTMAGREGVINTAIKTADTGYIQRKLIKFLEDIKVEYDGTVRNANDKIIQYVYGDNGINTEIQIEQKIALMSENNKNIERKYIYTREELASIKKHHSTKYTTEHNEALYKKLLFMRDRMRKIQKSINISLAAFKDSYFMPVDIHQLLINITNRVERNNDNLVDPYYVLSKIKEMYSGAYSKIMKYNKHKSVIKKYDEQKIKFLLKLYLYDYLAPKKCTHVHKLSKEEFDEIIEYFRRTIMLAKVEGGEMVGFVGAQSIGEPVTQTNLKSFHKSGTGKTVSGGLVRVKELLGVSKNIKTPVTDIVLEEKYKNDKVIASQIASYLKYTTLQDVVEKVDIYYDPNPYDKNSIMSQDEVTSIFEGGQGKSGCQTEIQGLPWILRVVLSKEKMIERNITIIEIKTSFCKNWALRFEDGKGSKKEYKRIIEKISHVAIVSNFDNSPEPIVHIRFDANNYNFNTLAQFQEMVVNKYKIKGINDITESNSIAEESYVHFDEEGNVANKKQFIISTDGINLHDMAQINGIDLLHTRCNDIVMINEHFGIEAARSAFIREFTKALDSTGGYSNFQHIELLADAITHMGYMIPVNRHGANKLDTDPFSRASFEKTVEQLLAAATFGESDHIRSVSARIMVGQLINGGTGCFDLLLDHVKIKQVFAPQKEKITTTLVKKKTTIGDLIKKKKNK